MLVGLAAVAVAVEIAVAAVAAVARQLGIEGLHAVPADKDSVVGAVAAAAVVVVGRPADRTFGRGRVTVLLLCLERKAAAAAVAGTQRKEIVEEGRMGAGRSLSVEVETEVAAAVAAVVETESRPQKTGMIPDRAVLLPGHGHLDHDQSPCHDLSHLGNQDLLREVRRLQPVPPPGKPSSREDS